MTTVVVAVAVADEDLCGVQYAVCGGLGALGFCNCSRKSQYLISFMSSLFEDEVYMLLSKKRGM